MPLPNILITGTPGTGKTETARRVSEATGLHHLNVGDLVKANQCYESKDESFDTYIIDDDKVCDLLEPLMEEGGQVVDFHSCDLFPERWFDLVLVLQVNTEVLFDRLAERGYNEKKRSENLECEIMQVVWEEAQESYDEAIVHALPSNTPEDLDNNVQRIVTWLENWKATHSDNN
eukprot:gene2392-2623_t